MKAKDYAVLRDCVENGVGYGVRRAHKHVEHPDKDVMADIIEGEVMNEICQYFDFEQIMEK